MITSSQLVVLLFTFGFPSTIIRLITDETHFIKYPKSNFLKKILWITFFSSIIIALTLYLFSKKIALNIFNDQSLENYLKLMSLFIMPLMFHDIFLNIFRGKKQYDRFNFFLFILPPLFYILIFYLLYPYIDDEKSVILSFGFSIATVFLIELLFIGKMNGKNLKNFPSKQLFKLSLPMMLSGTVLFLLNWTDVFMLSIMTTTKEVGIYNVAFKIATIGLLVILVINVVISPKIAELYSKNKLIQLKMMVIKSTRMITILTIPIVIIIIIFRKEILLFFGDEFILGEISLIILIISILINAISGNVDQVLNMTNNHILMKNISIVCLIGNIILNYILIPRYGINGAAIASLITTVSLNFISIYYIKRKLNFYTFIKK